MSRRPRESQIGDLSASFNEAFADWREKNSEYFLNKHGRFRPPPPGVNAMGTSGDYHHANESQALIGIERAYHFDRNNCIVGQALDRLCDHVLPDDFSLKPDTGDEGLNEALRNLWNDWAYDPLQADNEQQDDFCRLEWLGLRGMLCGGDQMLVPLADGSLQSFEAYRCRTPRKTTRNVIRGVLLDERRRRLQYWFTKEDVNPLQQVAKVSEIEPVNAFDQDGQPQVFHLYNPRRKSAVRGVSVMAPCVDMIGMHDDLQFATLVKAQVASCFAIIRELAASTTVQPPSLPNDPTAQIGQRTQEYSGDTRIDVDQIGPGMQVRGRPGETLSFASANIPSQEFFPHVHLILSIIAANLGISPLALLLDPQLAGNFSAYRAALLESRPGFRRLQKLLIQRLRTPTYHWRMRMAIKRDAALARQLVKLGPRFFRHEWKAPAWRYIEPVKDAQGDGMRITGLLNSRSQVASERGMDFPDLVTECVNDNSSLIVAACKKAQEINAEFPEAAVTWRDVLQITKAAQAGGDQTQPVDPSNANPNSGNPA